jgi:hypothetical protein
MYKKTQFIIVCICDGKRAELMITVFFSAMRSAKAADKGLGRKSEVV